MNWQIFVISVCFIIIRLGYSLITVFQRDSHPSTTNIIRKSGSTISGSAIAGHWHRRWRMITSSSCSDIHLLQKPIERMPSHSDQSLVLLPFTQQSLANITRTFLKSWASLLNKRRISSLIKAIEITNPCNISKIVSFVPPLYWPVYQQYTFWRYPYILELSLRSPRHSWMRERLRVNVYGNNLAVSVQTVFHDRDLKYKNVYLHNFSIVEFTAVLLWKKSKINV